MTALPRLLLCVLTVAACGPVVSHGGPVRDHVSFVDNLRALGFTVEPIGQTKVVPLEVPATGLAVSGRARFEVAPRCCPLLGPQFAGTIRNMP